MPAKTCSLSIASNRQELETHGTPMFPCARYSSDLEHFINKEIPWHWHEEIELIVVEHGSMKVQLNDTYFILNKGEGIFINSNILHGVFINGNKGCFINSFVFHTKLISGSIESIYEQRYIKPLTHCKALFGIPFKLSIPWHLQVLQCINEAFLAYDSNDFAFELLVREKLSYVWFLILKHHQPSLENLAIHESQDTIRIKKMLDFIHTHFAESLDVSQIAHSANLSQRECLRCFQKTIGIPPIQYLLKYRISVAARLLTSSDMPITTICNDTGFDSPSYFSKLFKRWMGCTPTSYRKAASTIET